MAAATTVALVGAGVSAIGGAVTANQAKKAAGRAGREAARASAEMNRIRNSRQAITNPYAGVTNLSGLAKDLSDMVSNPFSNLGVATQAAEIKMEQSDIALANTLDRLATTGASAGGATALAQAALASKKGVAATIENQEAENQKLEAQGQQRMEMLQMQEAARIQGIQLSEGARVQGLKGQGEQFMMGLKEQRSQADLDYAAGKESQAMANQAAANQAQAAAWGSAISGMGQSIAGAFAPTGSGSTGDTITNYYMGEG